MRKNVNKLATLALSGVMGNVNGYAGFCFFGR